MELLSYALEIALSAFLIYLTIALLDRGNYRNNPVNAIITAVILSFAGKMSFIFFFFGLIVWVYILINWYSIGFFKSFLCAFVYTVLNFLITLLVAFFIFGAGAVRHNAVLKKVVPVIQEKYGKTYAEKKERIEKYIEEKGKALKKKKLAAKIALSGKPKVTIVFKNGRSISCRILEEDENGYLINIADGESQALIRKDLVDHIEDGPGPEEGKK